MEVDVHGTANAEGSNRTATAETEDGASGRVLIYALGIALSSSTDNFAVGASLGLAGLVLHARFNLAIALANGIGALVAAEGGHVIGEVANSAGAWLAASVFAYLSWQEGASICRGEESSPLLHKAERGVVAQLAVPMTLNNLAGGVAGGVVGIGPLLGGASAFVASFLMMATGHLLGKTCHAALRGSRLDLRLFSCSIFAALAFSQVSSKLRGWWQSTFTQVDFTLAALGLFGVLLVTVGLLSHCCTGSAQSAPQLTPAHAASCPSFTSIEPLTTSLEPARLKIGVLVERCHALRRLRDALGAHAYASRKGSLLDELVNSPLPHALLEDGAAALEVLHASGFLESDAELVHCTDRLLRLDETGITSNRGVRGHACKSARGEGRREASLSDQRGAGAGRPLPPAEAGGPRRLTFDEPLSADGPGQGSDRSANTSRSGRWLLAGLPFMKSPRRALPSYDPELL